MALGEYPHGVGFGIIGSALFHLPQQIPIHFRREQNPADWRLLERLPQILGNDYDLVSGKLQLGQRQGRLLSLRTGFWLLLRQHAAVNHHQAAQHDSPLDSPHSPSPVAVDAVRFVNRIAFSRASDTPTSIMPGDSVRPRVAFHTHYNAKQPPWHSQSAKT
ncbi:hypothetical protein HRbin36_02842 [bacterium HR36]|nr:hypothetical protein HRbin36_02842 [bacterium HR36]